MYYDSVRTWSYNMNIRIVVLWLEKWNLKISSVKLPVGLLMKPSITSWEKMIKFLENNGDEDDELFLRKHWPAKDNYILIYTRNFCQKFWPSQISDTPRAGFQPAQYLNSGFTKWSCEIFHYHFLIYLRKISPKKE